MFSRRVKILFGVVSLAALMTAILAINARLSWRPVAIQFPPSISSIPSAPRHLPIAFRGEGLWLLALEEDNALFGTPGRKSSAPSQWQTVRNWNRAPLSIWRGTEFDNGFAAVGETRNLFARGRGDEWMEIWRNGKKTLALRENGHRNQHNVMQPGPVHLLAISPDGKRLVASSELYGYGDYKENLAGFCQQGMVLFDVQSGKQIARQSAFEGAFTDFAWSPDGREVAGITTDGLVFVLNGQSGKLRLKFRAHGLWGAQIAWSKDGNELVTASNPRLGLSPTRVRFSLKSGTGFMFGAGGTTTLGEGKDKIVVATKANGDSTWGGKTERLLKRFDARTGKIIGKPVGLQTGAVDLQFSPDGTQIALGQYDFALLLNAQTLKTERRLVVPLAPSAPGSVALPVCVAWSSDGRTLATSTQHGLMLWRVR